MIKSPFPGEFDALARQYWNTWNEMLGQPGGFQGWAPPGYESRAFFGTEHEENAWAQRLDIPLSFLDRDDP